MVGLRNGNFGMILQTLKRFPKLYAAIRYGLYGRIRSARRERVFQTTFKTNAWDDDFSVSGPGSNFLATQHIRAELPALLQSFEIGSLLDLPCGDFKWMKAVDLSGIAYTGGDIVQELIDQNIAHYPERTFLKLDIVKDRLPECDMVFVRDCFVHLSNRDILRALANVRSSGAQFLLSTTFPQLAQNQDTVTPYWRAINLSVEPFGLGPPLRLIRDYSDQQANDQGKHMGLWRL